jgi:glycerol-3-phosphate acyltransferase PlsY
MNFWVVLATCAAGSFLLGAIPFGLLVGRLHGIDVRSIGSGNVGAMNVGRILGRQWFFVVFILDLFKGLVPTLMGGWLLPTYASEVAPSILMISRFLVGFAAILGHNYSPFLKFRGGKGVSTSLGVALGVYPDLTLPAILAFGVWVAGFGVTRMSSVGSILGGVAFPVFYLSLLTYRGGKAADHWPFLAFSVLVAVLVVIRHKANIARILAGTETRVVRGGGKKSKSIA